VTDAVTTMVMESVHAENFGVYGAGRSTRSCTGRATGWPGAPSQRLMRAAGLCGISRAKSPRTTVPGTGPDTRPDLVERALTATGPDQLWVADITYCRTAWFPAVAGWVCAAFVTDVCSRRVVGRQLSRSLRTDLALDAWRWASGPGARAGRDVSGLVRHSDKGVQYLAVRHIQRLAEAGAVASVGSTGDSYDNALAEARSASFHRPSTKATSTGTTPRRLPSPRQFRASTEPGTGQTGRPATAYARPSSRSGPVAPPVAEQEFAQPLPSAGAGFDQVRPGPVQITYRLLGLAGDPDRDQFPGPAQPGQPPGIAPVGLDRSPGARGISDSAITSQRTGCGSVRSMVDDPRRSITHETEPAVPC
jgi:transposase InsO family protein